MMIIGILLLLIYLYFYFKFKPNVVFSQGRCYIWYNIKSKYDRGMNIRDYIQIY